MEDSNDIHQHLRQSPVIQEALKFAQERHRHQFRRLNPTTPYVQHPINVALLVQEAGGSEEAVAAALLHDVVEDTHTTLSEIQLLFGKKITEFVRVLTEEDRTLEWEIRRAQAREKLISADPQALLIKCADIIHNVDDLINYIEEHPHYDLWKHFKRGKEAKMESWLKTYGIIEEGDPTCSLLPKLADTLRKAEKTLP